MKIAVVGKGGSGKTSISGVLARSFARSGHNVVGLDCDTNPNLGLSLGQRAVLVASERGQGKITIVANKVADAEDEARVRDAFSDHDVVTIPADPVVTTADRKGTSPMDANPDAPAVNAIADLASLLAETDNT